MDIMLPPGLHFSFALGIVINTRQYMILSSAQLAMRACWRLTPLKKCRGETTFCHVFRQSKARQFRQAALNYRIYLSAVRDTDSGVKCTHFSVVISWFYGGAKYINFGNGFRRDIHEILLRVESFSITRRRIILYLILYLFSFLIQDLKWFSLLNIF